MEYQFWSDLFVFTVMVGVLALLGAIGSWWDARKVRKNRR